MSKTWNQFLGVAVAGALLSGCLSSDSTEDSTGTMSLDVTDAPVDEVEEVVVTFTGVTLKPRDGGQIHHDLEEPKTVNLLDLQRANVERLMDEEEVPAGEYNWIRLDVDESELHVKKKDGGEYDLRVPSGKLRLVSGFTVPAGGEVDFTIDVDLRDALVNPQGQDGYLLRPALRIVDNTEVGHVTGTVFSELIVDACGEDEERDSEGWVYVFEGHGVEPFGYYDGTDERPVTAAKVGLAEEESDYTYKATFLREGDYTLAYTCDADDPEADEDLTFYDERDVVIAAGETLEGEDFDVDNGAEE